MPSPNPVMLLSHSCHVMTATYLPAPPLSFPLRYATSRLFPCTGKSNVSWAALFGRQALRTDLRGVANRRPETDVQHVDHAADRDHSVRAESRPLIGECRMRICANQYTGTTVCILSVGLKLGIGASPTHLPFQESGISILIFMVWNPGLAKVEAQARHIPWVVVVG